jgi:hypothetical protein
MWSVNVIAQTTNIPDPLFEQPLINLNIDSDGVINGQVLTSDISSVINLNLNGYTINDITGIEDFESLKFLDLTYCELGFLNGTFGTLDLTSNSNLETLIMIGENDGIFHLIDVLDLSNNLFISNIDTSGNWFLKEINLQTGSTDVSNLNINIDIDLGFNEAQGNLQNDDGPVCIRVTDPVAATAGTGVYSTWTISAQDNPYFFSDTCNLSYVSLNIPQISVYPNPVRDKLFYDTKSQVENVLIYDNLGRKIEINVDINSKYINLSALNRGIYILKILTDKGVVQEKIIKS